MVHPVEPELAVELPSHFSLESFMVADENRLAAEAVLRVLHRPSSDLSPLFLHGPTASGKSHLLFGLADALSEKFQKSLVLAMTAGEFIEQCDAAWRQRNTADFRQQIWHADALLLDDIHLFAKHPASLEELLHVCNRLSQRNRLLVLASRYPPADLRSFSGVLRSRLVCGLIVALNPPRLALMQRVLEQRSRDHALRLTRSAAVYLLRNIEDLREMEGILVRLDETTPGRRRSRRKVTIGSVREAIDVIGTPMPTVASVTAAVCEYFGESITRVRSATRTKGVVFVRHTAMYLAREMTSASLLEIGRCFGRRDHTTVLHACSKIEELLQSDASFGRALRTIRRSLQGLE
jgi:chromosomal replication initiator protein